MSDLNNGKGRQPAHPTSKDDLTVFERPADDSSSISKIDDRRGPDIDAASSSKTGRASLDLNPAVEHGSLRRGLSARQVQMIAIAGVWAPLVPGS